jgi:hypothetical protein
VGSESGVEFDFGSVGHLVEGWDEVVVKGKELSISRSESRVVHVPEGDDLLNQQVNNIDLVVGGRFELGDEVGRRV